MTVTIYTDSMKKIGEYDSIAKTLSLKKGSKLMYIKYTYNTGFIVCTVELL